MSNEEDTATPDSETTKSLSCFSAKKSKLPSDSRLELGDITHHNIKQLRIINLNVFPVSYNDKFYRDVLLVGEFAKLAYFNDIVVGAVCCRAEPCPVSGGHRIYIMTLGCLAPYRQLGIGTFMLEHVFKLCERDPKVKYIYLHVQVNNEGALAFYKRYGFEIVEQKQNYYKRIEPADAYVLQKRLTSENGNGDTIPIEMTNGGTEYWYQWLDNDIRNSSMWALEKLIRCLTMPTIYCFFFENSWPPFFKNIACHKFNQDT